MHTHVNPQKPPRVHSVMMSLITVNKWIAAVHCGCFTQQPQYIEIEQWNETSGSKMY